MRCLSSSDRWWHNFGVGLLSVVDITGVVVNESMVRVGSGREVLGRVDNPIIRLPDGRPFIPGSSLKGVFRSLAESYLCGVVEGRVKSTYCNVDECTIDVNSCGEFLAKCSALPGSTSSGSEVPEYCVNYGLFGSQDNFSHILFFDMLPKGDAIVLSKPGTSIDRFLGSVREGALFTEEYIVPKTRWDFRIRLIGIIDENKGCWCCAKEILAWLLEMFADVGIHVGGRKSVTGALMRLEKDSVRVHVYKVVDGKIVEEEHDFPWLINELRKCRG